jgi:hypothetical protein
MYRGLSHGTLRGDSRNDHIRVFGALSRWNIRRYCWSIRMYIVSGGSLRFQCGIDSIRVYRTVLGRKMGRSRSVGV